MSDVNFGERKTPGKTTLDLESNPRSGGNDNYVGDYHSETIQGSDDNQYVTESLEKPWFGPN